MPEFPSVTDVSLIEIVGVAVTVMLTVATFESRLLSLALKVNESGPE